MSNVTFCTLLHGAASTPEFVQRTFGEALDRLGIALVAPDVRGVSLPDMVDLLAESVRTDEDIVGGVSLGAHAAATFASQTGFAGRLFAVMPAWIGRVGSVAQLTAHTADEVEALSAQIVLQRITEHAPDDWVVQELRRAWTSMPQDQLVESLKVAAEQSAPDVADLERIRASTEIVALQDDPTHPADVALEWNRYIAGSSLTVLPRDLFGRDSRALAEPLERWLSGFR